jgi:ABC-2 type transport system ATP-binding protein
MKPILARSLFKSYNGMNAVDDIDLDVKEGQIFGFLGPNGAGKSTVIKLLTTLIQPTSGGISVLEIDAAKEPLKIRKKIGVVLQQPSYEPTLSVEKSLEKYGMMWNIDKKTRKDRTEELLTAFNLVEIRKKRNEDLSIGQRRRVQVAREFMHDMDLLFLDEPTVGLDPTARRQLLDFLKNKVKEKNLTIFYTTHVLTEAEYLCDNIAIINKGRIITVDSPSELKKRFGREKTIKIHVSSNIEKLGSLLENIQDCKIEFNTRATITIQSTDSELILMNILKILNQNDISIDDLSAIPTNLEEIFLKVVSDSNASDNQTS